MFTRRFAVQVGERALKSLGQSLVLNIGATALNAFDANLLTIAGLAVGAAVLSVGTSLASYPISPAGTPSLVNPRPDPPAAVMRH